jgi:hypothetical protein
MFDHSTEMERLTGGQGEGIYVVALVVLKEKEVVWARIGSATASAQRNAR